MESFPRVGDGRQRNGWEGAALAALLAVVLAAMLGAPGSADRERPADGDMLPTRGALVRGARGDGARARCAGTLVSRDTFLAAGDCVASDLDPHHYVVRLPYRGTLPVARVALHADAGGARRGADLAVVTLAADVPSGRDTAVERAADGIAAVALGLDDGAGR